MLEQPRVFFFRHSSDMTSHRSGQHRPSQALHLPGHWSSWSGPLSSTPSLSVQDEAENEDGYVSWLAERVAHSMLEDEELADSSDPSLKLSTGASSFKMDYSTRTSMVASPNSTLPGLDNATNSAESSCASSQVPWPSSTHLKVEEDETWDLIYAGVGELFILQMLEEAKSSAMLFLVRARSHHPSTNPVPGLSQPPHTGWGHSYSSLRHETGISSFSEVNGFQARSNNFSTASPRSKDRIFVHPSSLRHSVCAKTEQTKLMQFQASKPGLASRWACQTKLVHQHDNALCRGGQKAGSGKRRGWLSDATCFPSPSHFAESGMQAVFLQSNMPRPESCGTGVFLPRMANTSTEAKKPSFSTVLLPSRVVKALNLNVKDPHSLVVGTNPSSCGSINHKEKNRYPSSILASSVRRNLSQPKKAGWMEFDRQVRPIQCLVSKADSETSLPSEWIY